MSSARRWAEPRPGTIALVALALFALVPCRAPCAEQSEPALRFVRLRQPDAPAEPTPAAPAPVEAADPRDAAPQPPPAVESQPDEPSTPRFEMPSDPLPGDEHPFDELAPGGETAPYYDESPPEQRVPHDAAALEELPRDFDHGLAGDWYTYEAGYCRRENWLIPPHLFALDTWLGHKTASALCADGWIEQGFTWNPDSPPDRFNTNVGFNDRANEYQLNQLYLILAKPVCNERCQWDVGARVDLLYGTDYFFTEALGLETHSDGTQRWNSDHGPRADGTAALYGLAMPQLYADVYAPWGYGAQFRFGHFYTIIGYETVPAVNNFFYSHSYSKLYGEPFTHTGFLGSYSVLPNAAIMGGLVRGWDTWEDPNNDQGFLGGLTWDSCDRFASFTYAIYAGDEQANLQLPGDTRVMYSANLTLRPSDRFSYVLQYDRGSDENADETGVDADWYSIVQYFFYNVSPCWQWGCRFEWFRDEDGTRIENDGQRGDYFECTVGANWRPTPRVMVRPELRVDWSQTKGQLPFDSHSDSNQLLMATDVIYRF